MNETAPTVLSGGYAFTECPRWHDDRLWFVDMHHHQVIAVEAAGAREIIVELPEAAGGLGWLPSGDMLIVGHNTRKIWRFNGDGLTVHADLSGVGDTPLNDMWVDSSGRAYVGEFGFDVHKFLADPAAQERLAAATGGEIAIPPGNLYRVEVDGVFDVVGTELSCPNGIVIDEGSRSLVVAETFGARLSAYRINDDGSLTDRRLITLGFYPDGIGFDGDGALWVSDPGGRGARLVDLDGQELRRVSSSNPCFACAVGGSRGTTLYLCTGPTSNPAESRRLRGACIESIELA